MKELDLSKIEILEFPSNQYYRTDYLKTQIVIHHTASGKGVDGDFKHWLSNSERVATCVIIDYKGTIYQLYSSKFWGHHIGVTSTFLKNRGYVDYRSRNRVLNQQSVAIEIDNWGGLELRNGKYYAWPYDYGKDASGKSVTVPASNVMEYEESYRGFKYYEKYTDSQIKKVRQLLVFWNKKYDIPLDYNEDMWDVSDNALGGEPGVWTHTSYRDDKSDCHPDPKLIKMLKEVK